MTRTPAESHPGPDGGVPDEPSLDPEVMQLAGQVFDLARDGDTDRLAAYVDAGVPVNLCTDRGDTLVMLAAYHGHAATTAALLRRGADPDRTNDAGRTPMSGAVLRGEDAVVDLLLGAGADPAAGDPSALETARLPGREHLLARLGDR